MNDNKPLAALAEELERIGNEAASFLPMGDWDDQDRAISALARAVLLISQAMKDLE